MGWFWGSTPDPTKNLDPELQEYLRQETPAPYTLPDSASTTTTNPSSNNASSSPTSVPSLFPDGRYAHLWKTYKPLAETESTHSQAAAERVIEKFKARKDAVQDAAMENCALEHEALSTCFQKGDWWSMAKARATMCADENRKFSRCFTTQAKFLQALGYAAAMEWDAEKEERIQMHADKLYHQMLDYERRVAEARAAGDEPPPITSLFSPTSTPVPMSQDDNITPGGEQLPAGFTPPNSLKGLTPHERELEIRSINADLQQKRMYVDEASPYLQMQQEARNKRQEKAKSWFGETIGKWIT
ncbi:hypothetical protein BGW36DRAFT_375181 [Talaromyces proteolyticus]|uniref:Uncharacterized protein n=1 Tax=Talaromyces proteolyticus TaxID=1131652 RepID=A0AAD4Q300_9EURO|nr:uncharacterized protein BGW36DRAFT_375181 [Talaromyces proteolyticus]KAH8700883.1 hypothetical protein BGW36DRAFT_375181 [Talaromyces proteolyticus]